MFLSVLILLQERGNRHSAAKYLRHRLPSSYRKIVLSPGLVRRYLSIHQLFLHCRLCYYSYGFLGSCLLYAEAGIRRKISLWSYLSREISSLSWILGRLMPLALSHIFLYIKNGSLNLLLLKVILRRIHKYSEAKHQSTFLHSLLKYRGPLAVQVNRKRFANQFRLLFAHPSYD